MKLFTLTIKVRLIIFFLAFIIHHVHITAQQYSKNDSLQNILKHYKEDTLKVNKLNSISSNLVDSREFEEAMLFANQALSLSQKLNFKKGEGRAYINIGNIFSDEGKNEEAIKSYIASLKIMEQLGNKKGMANCYNNIGIVYWGQGDYSEALKNNYLSLSLQKKIGDKNGMADSYIGIGNIFIGLGKYPDAIENYLASLKIYEKLGADNKVADTYNNIGVIYWFQKKYDEALKKFQANLTILKGLNKEQASANTINNIGNVYYDQGNYDKALKYYITALEIREKFKDKKGIATFQNNIGAIFQRQNNYTEALKKFFAALKLHEELGNKDEISAIYLNIGNIYVHQKKYQEAGKYLNMSLQLAKEIKAHERIKDSYQELSVLDSVQGNWKDAFTHYNLYVVYRDSLLNKENIEKTVQVEMNYEFEKKEEATKLEHEKDLAIAEEKTKSQRRFWIIGFISITIIALLSFIFWRKRKNYRFEQQISEVKQEALNAQMSDHFIGNAMDSINGFIEDNNKEKASEYLLLFSRLIRTVLENSFEKMVPLERDLEVLKNYLDLERLRFKEGELKYEIVIDDGIDKNNVMIPPMIFQVLTENSIKHGFKKSIGGELKIKIKKEAAILKCIVKDNGIGRKASMRSKSGESKTSIGSGLAEKLINLSGQSSEKTSYRIIDLMDAANNPLGTRVEFTMPYVSTF